MSYSRPSVIDIFKKELTSEKKSDISGKMIKMLEENPLSLSRIFDDCPCPLPSDDINTLIEEFKNILSQVQPSDDASNLCRLEDQIAVDRWIYKIARLGVSQLLTFKKSMKHDFIEYFELKEFQHLLGPSKSTLSILCGFISRVNQEVMHQSSEEIEQNQRSYTAICNYLNDPKNNKENLKDKNQDQDPKKEIPNNIKRIAKGVMFPKTPMLKPSYIPDRENPQFEKLAHWSIEKPSNGSLMVLAAITAATAASAAASYVFFKRMDRPAEIQEAKRLLPEVPASFIHR